MDRELLIEIGVEELPAPWLRYIERSLREAFDLGATPIKLRVRRRSD